MTVEQSIDDKIHGIVPPQQEQQASATEEQAETKEISEEKAEANGGKEHTEVNIEASKPSEKVESVTVEDGDTDEYGIEVPKERTYSEKEVQQMIRDRLKRGDHQPMQQQAIQQATNDFQVDPNSEETWEAQLEKFIDRRLETREQTVKQKELQRQAHEIQAEFESKFSTGMEKYSDFREVVGKLPITDAMMMSIRDMDNPATFLYAAAKLQPEEVKKIASMADPFQQAKAMGQLDERMRKAKSITRAAAPLKSTGSDVSEKYVPTRSIDDKIQSDAKKRYAR